MGAVNCVATVSTVDSCNYLPSPPRDTRAPSTPGPPHYRGFTTVLRHITLGRTPLDEWSVRRRDLYLTTHNTHKRQTSMLTAGYEPAFPASKRPQDLALDSATTGIGLVTYRITYRMREVLNYLASFDSYTPSHASKAIRQTHASYRFVQERYKTKASVGTFACLILRSF